VSTNKYIMVLPHVRLTTFVSPPVPSSDTTEVVAKAKREAEEILKQARAAGASLLEVGRCVINDMKSASACGGVVVQVALRAGE